MYRCWAVIIQVQELQPGDAIAAKGIARLQPIVAERQEKLKDEMLGTCCTSVYSYCFCENRLWNAHFMHVPHACVLSSSVTASVGSVGGLLTDLLCDLYCCRQTQRARQYCAWQVRHVT